MLERDNLLLSSLPRSQKSNQKQTIAACLLSIIIINGRVQSASLYVVTNNGETGRKVRPWELVSLRYLNKCLTAIQWISNGNVINWQSLLMEKEMLGLVIEQYCCNSPSMLLYMLASVWDKEISTTLLSLLPDVIGASHSLVSNKPHMFNSFLTYFYWLRCKMFLLKTTSIPNK